MSAFLGPIHYWMYNKILLQEDLIEKILKLSVEKNWDKSIAQLTADRFGEPEKHPLEEIIDTSNIHGWLQEKVSVAEYRLAFLVTKLLKEDSTRLNDIEKTFFDFGKENAIPNGSNVEEAFKFITDSLLDGMPCDGVNTLVSESDKEIVWKRNHCVHKSYWDEVGGNVDVYYKLRMEIIKGMTTGCGFKFEVLNDTVYKLTK